MKKLLLILFAVILTVSPFMRGERFVGGDISLLPEYEKAGAVYKDISGNIIPDLLPWLKTQGMNAMRVRLFVNPSQYLKDHPSADKNACQDLEYITPICKRVVDNGMDLMLDFHYSDTWADPAKQWTPTDWQNLTDEQLYQKIYDYTKESLETLKAEGIEPTFIQPGNEISYGMLWGKEGDSEANLKKVFMNNSANWARFGKLLSQAIKACREVCPDAKIVIHTERVAQADVEKYFYDKMKELNVDYDIIGLSYYPYFHGKINVLNSSLTMLEANYPDKEIMIVETGYAYAWEVPGTDKQVDYPYSPAGQNQFASALVNTLESHKTVDGLFWWWLEYNAYSTNLSGWYNAPLFDSRDGKALPALTTICSFADSSAVNEISADTDAENEEWYNLSGVKVSAPSPASAPGIYLSRTRKVIIK
ncbi:MAG: arabinogalactan endo-1,4-beta-galactosidase [Muribaculaceae bacterium]|nr:arabinogalactan endo-1,4-beta-galactosidase [Muribaculaceae bacterium]